MPLAVDREQIAEIVDGFGHSARNVELAGLDGVEIHAAHAWLVGQFLSPQYNHRHDAYGGSVRNRARLALEIGEAVRARTRGLVVGIQLSVDEYIGAEGITADDTAQQLELFAASGLFDYVNVSTGGTYSGHLTIPTMEVPEGFLADHGVRAKQIVGDRMKVVLTGRIRTLETAAALLADGAADMFAMTRAQFADPQLVRKGMEGRSQEIVPCIGENDCIMRVLGQRLPVTCLMNPAMGRERDWGDGTLVPADPALRVIVVGAGPAGLKAAALAARRGHAVTILERRSASGGHLVTLSRLPGRAAWTHAIASFEYEARRAGVEFRLGTEADADSVVGMGPDVVLCATGAYWERTGVSPGRPGSAAIPGFADSAVLDIESAIELALEDRTRLGERIVIVDETGGYLPLGLADLLSAGGAWVEVVTRHAVVALEVQQALDAPHVLGRLAGRDVHLTPGHLLEEVDGSHVVLREGWSGRRRTVDRVDRVVLCMLRQPEQRVFEDLRPRLADVRLIGDALAPRGHLAILHEAEAVARSL